MRSRTKIAVKKPAGRGKDTPVKSTLVHPQTPTSSPLDLVYHLQQTVGNRIVQGLFRSGKVRVRPEGNQGIIRRTPFPGETPELEQRRLAAIEGAQNAIKHIEHALRSGYLWPFETQQRTNILFDDKNKTIVTQKERNASLARLVDDLWKLVTKLQGKPIPEKWLNLFKGKPEPDVIQYDVVFADMTIVPFPCNVADPFCSDVELFYTNYMKDRGRESDEAVQNSLYIKTTPIPKQKISEVSAEPEFAHQTWLIVKDPVNRPQEWEPYNEYGRNEGHIVKLFDDRRGYFYYWYGEKKYIPNYPTD